MMVLCRATIDCCTWLDELAANDVIIVHAAGNDEWTKSGFYFEAKVSYHSGVICNKEKLHFIFWF